MVLGQRKDIMAKTLVKPVVPTRKYEVTYLVSSGLTSSELTAVRDEIATLVGKYKGKISETEDWGKKALAYVIKAGDKSHNEAFYTHLVVEMPANQMPKLDKELQLKKEVIRSLIVKVD